MYQFVETIQIKDGIPALIDLHQQRINGTFLFFKSISPPDITSIIVDYLEKQKLLINQIYKLRFLYNLDSSYSIQLAPYHSPVISSFTLIENNDIDYTFKSTNRAIFEQLKASVQGEVIIVKNGFVTDTSFSNIILLKDSIWYTPKTYLLNGVQRQHLLASNKIQEKDIKASDIKCYSHIKIINALNQENTSCAYCIEKIINASYY